jgi:hypothetical protein
VLPIEIVPGRQRTEGGGRLAAMAGKAGPTGRVLFGSFHLVAR